MALPKVIHVREDHDNNAPKGTSYLTAFKGGVSEAVEDDGPTIIGVYKLVSRLRVVKRPHVLTSVVVRG